MFRLRSRVETSLVDSSELCDAFEFVELHRTSQSRGCSRSDRNPLVFRDVLKPKENQCFFAFGFVDYLLWIDDLVGADQRRLSSSESIGDELGRCARSCDTLECAVFGVD